MCNFLIVLGIILFGLIMIVVGIAAVCMSNPGNRDAHPPDPDHKQWPQDGDDP